MLARMMVAAKRTVTPSPFGDFLRQIMERYGHESIADLVRLIGVDQSSVSRWLMGQSEPSLDNLNKIANNLGLSMDELLIAAGVLPKGRASGTPAIKPRRLAPVLADVQKFLDDEESTNPEKQFLLKSIRGLLNMTIEAHQGVEHEASHAERQRRR